MNTLNYFVEANICLVFFYALYRVLLHNETRFGFNRMYLLGAIGISVAVPFLKFGNLGSLPAIGDVLPTYWLPEVVIGNASASVEEVNAGTGVHFWSIVVWGYLLVAGFLLLRFLYRCIRLTIFIRTAPLFAEIQKVRVLAVQETATAFSVFRYIIIGNPSSLTDEERDLILRHEMVHVQQRHTWDRLAAEILCIVFWFNPVTREIKKKLRDVHEFQADEKASEGNDPQTYCSLLARISLQSAGFGLASHFNKSLTIKRINMIKTMKTKLSRWKVAVMVPAVAGVLAFVACQDQVMSDLNTVAQNSSVALDVPRQVQDRYDQLNRQNPDSRYVILEVQNGGLTGLSELEKQYGLTKSFEIIRMGDDASHVVMQAPPVNGPTVTRIPVTLEGGGDNSRTFAIVEFTDQVQALSNSTMQEGEIFLVVEETAHPDGGMEKFYAFVKENMSYPAEARKDSIEGRVFIEFVVEKDGSLTNFKSLKSIGHGCDEEAIRVLALSPPWVPAQQKGEVVRQRMVLPVVFNL